MSYQIIANEKTLTDVEVLIEGLRYKGRGVFRKKPIEKISYIKLLLWPVRYFEINYSVKGIKANLANLHATRNFMLGNFSMNYLKNTLQNEGGRKALGLIFSRENQAIIQSITLMETTPPVLPYHDPSEIYNQLYNYYTDYRSELETKLEETKTEMKSVYDEADSFQRKAETIKKRLETFSGDKKSLNYKNLRSSLSEFNKKAKQLRRQADSAIATEERNLQIFTRKWIRGKRRYLGLRKNSSINKFGNLKTFYYVYWVARLESTSSVRYLIIDKNGLQVRKLQNMLNFDQQLRNELDTALHFKSFSSEIKCYYCGTAINKTADVCSSCKKEVIRCAVCKLLISQDDSIATCPKCGSQGHLSHLHEWVKTQGKCPTCLRELKLRNLQLSDEEE